MLANWSSPLKLVQLAVFGILLSASCLLVPPLVLVLWNRREEMGIHVSPWTYFLFLALALMPSLIGSVLLALATRKIVRIREKNERTETEMGLARAWLRSSRRAVRIVLLLMLGCFFASAIVSRMRSPEFRLAFYVPSLILFPALSRDLAQIREALSPEPPPRDPMDWAREYKPLRSEHWGERDVIESDPDSMPQR